MGPKAEADEKDEEEPYECQDDEGEVAALFRTPSKDQCTKGVYRNGQSPET